MQSVDIVRSLLNIEDGSHDMQIMLILDAVAETICNYCNIDKVPDGLKYTQCRMAVDMYKAESVGGETTGTPASISEGDTSVSFRDITGGKDYAVYADGVMKNYTTILNRYRVVKSPCQSCQTCKP